MTDTQSSTDIINEQAAVYVPVVEACSLGTSDAISVGILRHDDTGRCAVSIAVTSKDGTGHAALLGPDDMLKFDAALSDAYRRIAAVARGLRANDKPAPTATH